MGNPYATFAGETRSLIVVAPTTGRPYLVVGWSLRSNDSQPDPVLVPLDRHGFPKVHREGDGSLDWLRPGEDVESYRRDRDRERAAEQVATDWPETARDLISSDQERVDRHLPPFGR